MIAIGSKLWVWIRKERELEQGVSPTECEDVTPPVDTVRRDALRAAAEARRRLSGAEEQVRAAEEDWNFARAQFGSAAAEEYGRRLEAAKAAIARGFDTYKQIEHTPDSHAKRRLATTITEALDKNLPPLQDASKEFAAQREKRSSLPVQLADARERLVEELADLERSKEELSSIAGLYPESMLASLQDNPQRAAQLLESARAALETAGAHLESDTTRAASALDTAQRALAMANAQTDAIFSAKTDLDAFRERLAASIGSVSAALSDAKQLDSTDAFSPLLDEAEAAIVRGQRALVSDEDPLGALENLRGVELRMDAVLAPLMTQEEARRKAKETAQRHIRDADAALAWARKYLKDHEGSALLNVNKLMSEAEQAMTEAHKALDEDPLASERSRFEGRHTHQPSTCGTRATIEEVDADSPPHDADSHDHVTHASTQGIGSPRTYFHPHTTITYTGLTQPACDTRYTIIETLHSTMVYIDLFATHQGGSHATDSGNSSSYALWKPGRMPRSIRFAMGGATRETRTQHHGRPLPHTH